MGREAVAVLPSRALPVAVRRGQEPQADAQLTSLRKQLGYGRRLRPRRSHFALIALVIVAFWVVLSFGRTITQLNAANDRRTGLMAETAALSAQIDAGHRELDLVQTDGFQALQARAFGIGAPGEIAFSLEAGAPVASEVTPLGSVGREGQAQTPLDAWLRLLFGD